MFVTSVCVSQVPPIIKNDNGVVAVVIVHERTTYQGLLALQYNQFHRGLMTMRKLTTAIIMRRGVGWSKYKEKTPQNDTT